MMSRTPGQKAAASQASTLFGNYYPELLVRHNCSPTSAALLTEMPRRAPI